MEKWNHGDKVEVFIFGKWWKTTINCFESHNAPIGYVLLAGIPKMEGPFSYPVKYVRRLK